MNENGDKVNFDDIDLSLKECHILKSNLFFLIYR